MKYYGWESERRGDISVGFVMSEDGTYLQITTSSPSSLKSSLRTLVESETETDDIDLQMVAKDSEIIQDMLDRRTRLYESASEVLGQNLNPFSLK